MTVKILVALQSFGEFSDIPVRLLENSGAEIRYNRKGHRLVQEEIVELAQGCQGIIAGIEPYDREVLEHLLDLRCISRSGVGTDNIDQEYAQKKNITILNTPDVVVQPVAEMTLALIFDLLRFLTYHTSIIQSGQWKKQAGHILSNRKIGIIGLGRIGKRVAEYLRFFHADVMGYDLYPDDSWAEKHGVRIVDLTTLIETSDVISLHVSLSTENPFMLGEPEFAAMKKGTIIINTSRGQVIDETALYERLCSGHLGGAGLDVFRKEPYVGPLSKLKNVVLTPHISTLTEESRSEMERESVVNLLKFLSLPIQE
jgi:D-3-phosphoglycerate dehydrogenase / 2-oxoglutarate reductase